ncbi:unnamed protein product [Ranitomeya imitator]|uniref:Uncharacterized protein n=1 Tax=Ranitomeya imitator TaxID=111125 RepID=A0ABN9LPB8_9NEOB|nr:unnamed protein product [Ranitomeya imitator]
MPIVASTDSILSPIAIYLEKILTPLIQSSKSFLLDTGSILEVLRGLSNIPPNALLVSLDFGNFSLSKIDIDQTNLCIELLTLVLSSNHFIFQDEFYLQIRGTAMGYNLALPYANCYMADFEESKIYPNNLYCENVLLWKRYINNIFCIRGRTLESLLSFFDLLNSSWPGINLTM